MKTAPLVSVCVPVYNGEPYLRATLDSVRAQTWQDFELVVVENRSTDGSLALIEDWMRQTNDPRMRLSINDVHLNMFENMNRALSLATGKYVKVLCADDLLEPDCLKEQVAALETFSTAVLATCCRKIIAPNGRELFVRNSLSSGGLHEGRETIRKCFQAGTNIIGEPSAVLIRRAAIVEGDVWMEADAPYFVDMDFWLRLLLAGDACCVWKPLAAFRIHSAAATKKLERSIGDDFFRVWRKISAQAEVPLNPLQRFWIRLKINLMSRVRGLLYRVFG